MSVSFPSFFRNIPYCQWPFLYIIQGFLIPKHWYSYRWSNIQSTISYQNSYKLSGQEIWETLQCPSFPSFMREACWGPWGIVGVVTETWLIHRLRNKTLTMLSAHNMPDTKHFGTCLFPKLIIHHLRSTCVKKKYFFFQKCAIADHLIEEQSFENRWKIIWNLGTVIWNWGTVIWNRRVVFWNWEAFVSIHSPISNNHSPILKNHSPISNDLRSHSSRNLTKTTTWWS